jgi:MFS family permease
VATSEARGPASNERSVVAPVLRLFAGLALLMVGNGRLGSFLGVRSDLEGFPTVVISVVMSMYYGGFLVGSLTIPWGLVAVGHLRVFVGLVSLAAAAALSYALVITPIAWGGLRFVFGLCMSGLYVTIESWLNEGASNQSRGSLLSVHMLVVTLGLGAGQLLPGVADPPRASGSRCGRGGWRGRTLSSRPRSGLWNTGRHEPWASRGVHGSFAGRRRVDAVPAWAASG